MPDRETLTFGQFGRQRCLRAYLVGLLGAKGVRDGGHCLVVREGATLDTQSYTGSTEVGYRSYTGSTERGYRSYTGSTGWGTCPNTPVLRDGGGVPALVHRVLRGWVLLLVPRYYGMGYHC